MRVANQLTIEIPNKELLDIVQVGMPDYDIESILTIDSYFNDGNLYLEIKLKNTSNFTPVKKDVKTKVCTECNKEKDLSEFSINPDGSDGTNTKCKNCRSIYMKEKRDFTKKEQTVEDLVQHTYLRAPNQTALFLNWLETGKYNPVDINEFIKQNPTVTLEQAKTIVAHQIRLGKLQQLSATSFRVNQTVQA